MNKISFCQFSLATTNICGGFCFLFKNNKHIYRRTNQPGVKKEELYFGVDDYLSVNKPDIVGKIVVFY